MTAVGRIATVLLLDRGVYPPRDVTAPAEP